MKKIINAPESYVDEMLKGIYAAHGDQVKHAGDDLRCYCTAHKKPGKIAIITGGGSGHLPLFLGYVGDGLIDGCGVGGVFQSPSPEQIYNIAKEVEAGAGVLYLYGNYTGDIMTFDMATDLCDMDDIVCKSIVGADDVLSHKDPATRRGVAGIYFMFKAAGCKADEGGTLDEVLAAAQLAKDNTRTVGFALTPCIIPEVGHANFELGENEMAMGMGIHGEPGIWNGPLKTSRRDRPGVPGRPAGRHACGRGGGGLPADQRPGRHLHRRAVHPVQRCHRAAGGEGHQGLPAPWWASMPPPWRWRAPPSLCAR